MQADERIVSYMKERDRYAATVACVAAVQLFALAVYFCLYALIRNGVFYSLSEDYGKVVIICISFVIATGVCVLDFLTVIRGRKVYITRPDSIAINDGKEIVDLAYKTARPVLIYRITYSMVIAACAVLVYIMLHVFMDDQDLAKLYGRIVVCVIVAIVVLLAYPCIDRIACYRALLGQTHELYFDPGENMVLKYILAFTVPMCISLWYVLCYYGNKPDTAWMVFPVTALFVLAISFLAGWTKMAEMRKKSVDNDTDI